ncbi:ATP-binding cassette domain-containing protein, partial [Vibrio campbellii]
MTTDDIITMMVGREMKQLFPREEHDIGEVILQANNICAWDKANSNIPKVKNASFELRKGEILGVSGLVGAGRTELMECLYGCYQGKHSGNISLYGEQL